MSYLNDKRRRLGGRELTQPGQVQNPGPVQKQPTPAPQAVQTTTQQPRVQTQAAPKVMEKQTQTQPAPATQPSVPAQTGGQDAVVAAQNLLSQQLGSYQSQYGSQIDSLIQQLQGQQPFTYDVNTDPLYLQLRDQWMRDGKLAMEDTMGQAAQLTGGYGNSYAQTAGQQVYNAHLQGVNEMIPQLKEAARADYDAENAYLMQQLGLLMDQDSQDYSRWMDELERQRYEQEWQYQQDRDALADQRYDREWEYQQGRDQLADQRYQDELAYGRGQDAYDRLLEMIATTGYKPTAEELAAAGMSESQAKAWLGYWQGQQAGSGGSGGGGPKYYNNDPKPADEEKGADPESEEPAKRNFETVREELYIMAGNGASRSVLVAYANEAYKDGEINSQQLAAITRWANSLSQPSAGKTPSGSGAPTKNNRYNALN